MSLPAEVVLQILRETSAEDVCRASLTSRRMNLIVRNNARSLPRMKFEVKVSGKSGQKTVELRKVGCGLMRKETFVLDEFTRWNSVDIESLELNEITHDENVIDFLNNLCGLLKSSRQSGIKSLSMKKVHLEENAINSLQQLFMITLGTCQKLLFRDCILPAALTPAMVQQLTVFDHFRWIDCAGEMNSNDDVIQRFARELKKTKEQRAFLAEVNSVTVDSICEFIESWLSVSTASFFNLTLKGCDSLWKETFERECDRKRMEHYAMEFASKAHKNAHIKVVFSEVSATCRIWPVFDVPARQAGNLICHARYYRDF